MVKVIKCQACFGNLVPSGKIVVCEYCSTTNVLDKAISIKSVSSITNTPPEHIGWLSNMLGYS